MNTDWHDLIQRHMVGTLDVQEAAILQSGLKTNPELRTVYLHYMNLDVALEAHAGSSATVNEMLISPNAAEPNRSARWFAWRPLIAAAAGIVFGMFCTSVVFGYVAQRAAVKRTPLPIFDPGFESMKPLDKGLPHNLGEWGVRAARMVPAENGVQPLQGHHMLRMEPILVGDQDDNHYSQAYQILDLHSLPLDEGSGAMEAQVKASFCAPESLAKARYLIRVVALSEPPATATENFWSKAEHSGVVSLTQRFETEAGDSDWHAFSVKMPLPVGTRSLVIILSATSPKDETVQAPVRYLDDVQVSLLTSSTFQP